MGNGTPGIVIVSTFCSSNAKQFAGYIRYMDRPEAVKKKYLQEFDLFSGYMDYMGNPEKTDINLTKAPEKISGLFTSDIDAANDAEVLAIKRVFETAQENDSLMWQTVISFDNAWLEEMGVYDGKTGILNEKIMRNAARTAVNSMLEKENLENAVWTAAFHFNTDNVHIHISIVEPYPMRKKKLYEQYERVQVDGKWQYLKVFNEESKEWERVPVENEDGEIVIAEEYVGKFKESSLKTAKKVFVSELENNQEINQNISKIVRERILAQMKERELYEDEDFRESFLALYEKLPENKGVCNYGNSAMADLRDEIDALSSKYIEKYHKEDFEELQRMIEKQQEQYQRIYGGKNQYAENVVRDLYYRMGNTILREMKAYDKRIKALPDLLKETQEIKSLNNAQGRKSSTEPAEPRKDYTGSRKKHFSKILPVCRKKLRTAESFKLAKTLT